MCTTCQGKDIPLGSHQRLSGRCILSASRGCPNPRLQQRGNHLDRSQEPQSFPTTRAARAEQVSGTCLTYHVAQSNRCHVCTIASGPLRTLDPCCVDCWIYDTYGEADASLTLAAPLSLKRRPGLKTA